MISNTFLIGRKSVQKTINSLYKLLAVNLLFHTVCIRYKLCDFIKNYCDLTTTSFVGSVMLASVKR